MTDLKNQSSFNGDGFYLLSNKPTIADRQEEALAELLVLDEQVVYDSDIQELAKANSVSLFTTYTAGWPAFEGAAVKGDVITLMNIESPYGITCIRDDPSEDEKIEFENIKAVVLAKLINYGIDSKIAEKAFMSLVRDADQCIMSCEVGNKHLLLVITDN